jgi:hypothetical protein
VASARFDEPRTDLAAQACHQGLNGVAVWFIVPIDMLNEFTLRDDPVPVVSKVSEKPKL